MTFNQHLLYNILASVHIGVQYHAQDSALWRVYSNLPAEMPFDTLTVADLLLCVKCALQMLLQVTKDPFLDIEMIANHDDCIIIRVLG